MMCCSGLAFVKRLDTPPFLCHAPHHYVIEASRASIPLFQPPKKCPKKSEVNAPYGIISHSDTWFTHIILQRTNSNTKGKRIFWCCIHFSFPIIAFYVCFPLLTQIDPPSLLTRGYFSLSAYLGGFYGKKVYFYSLQHHEAALKDCWSTRFSTLTQFSHQVSK